MHSLLHFHVNFDIRHFLLLLSKLRKMSNKPPNVVPGLGSSSLLVKPIKVEEKPKLNKFKCSASENKLKVSGKGIKERIVNKVRSWSSRDKYATHEGIEVETALAKSPTPQEIDSESMEHLAHSNLTRARDSLENLLKDERNMPNDHWTSRACSSTPETSQKSSPESQKSAPDTSKTAAKNLIWDPFDKKSRKNRNKDLGRKKKKHHNESPKKENSSMPLEGKPYLSKTVLGETDETETVEEEYSYKYEYFPKNSKSVVFTNEVFVVYFHENDVVYESKEPLKKDIDQQERNKEMRQGHLLKTQEKYNLCLY
ncbi:unnamed protein product [Phaedon cochleariae]|uniref:Uncharacterized protein n=1 Tax=Phaedon cochleariae TaxID=80249 RepID=A0A9P0DHJ6_PHACE|nr:unnamed protein product [Phaedon cochleariae]